VTPTKAVRVHVQARLNRHARLQCGYAHQRPPEKRGPVIRFWREVSVLVQETIVTRREGIVHDHRDLLLGESAELVHIAKRVEEGVGPWIPATCGVGGFGQPQPLARRELAAESAVEGERFFRTAEPLLGERLIAVVCIPMAAQRSELAPEW